jgi:hypothetical protein
MVDRKKLFFSHQEPWRWCSSAPSCLGGQMMGVSVFKSASRAPWQTEGRMWHIQVHRGSSARWAHHMRWALPPQLCHRGEEKVISLEWFCIQNIFTMVQGKCCVVKPSAWLLSAHSAPQKVLTHVRMLCIMLWGSALHVVVADRQTWAQFVPCSMGSHSKSVVPVAEIISVVN